MFTISVRRFHDIGKGKTIPVIYLVLTLLNPINQMANDYGWFSQLEHLNIVVIIVLSIMAIIFAIGSIVISIMALVYCVQDSEKVRTNMDQILKNTCMKHKSYQINFNLLHYKLVYL